MEGSITMKRIFMLAVALACVLAAVHPAPAQDLASQVVGIWKLKTFERKALADGKTAKLYGEKPAGYFHYSKGGHFATVGVGEGRKVPPGGVSKTTEAEKAALFNSMYAYAGTYRVEGETMTISVDATWNHDWAGANLVRKISILGKTLTIETPPFKSNIDGSDVVVISTFERVE